MSATHHPAGTRTLTLQVIIGLLFFYFLMPNIVQAGTCRVWVPIAVDDISFIIPVWIDSTDTTGYCYDVTSPTDGAYVSQSNPTITGTVGDEITSFKINDETVTVTNNAFSHALVTALPEGANTITLELSNANNSTEERTFTVNVDTIEPTISSNPVLTGSSGQLYSYQLAVSDGSNTTLTYELLSSPTGMTISSTGLIEWTPSGVFGEVDVSVKVTDGVGNIITQTFKICE